MFCYFCEMLGTFIAVAELLWRRASLCSASVARCIGAPAGKEVIFPCMCTGYLLLMQIYRLSELILVPSSSFPHFRSARAPPKKIVFPRVDESPLIRSTQDRIT